KGLYRNDLPAGNHWVKIRCTGIGGTTGSNYSALGTMVRAKATINGTPTWQMREVSAQNSFNSQNALDVHFGLGDATVIDSLVIRWPGGIVEYLTDVPTDQSYTATEGSGIVTGVREITSTVPERAGLDQNYPNPFNPSTAISFRITQRGPVRLTVFDLLGREQAVLVDEIMEPGSYRAKFDAVDRASSGVYFYRLQTNGFTETRRMILLK
ncbi:MAG: ASPIC/UnbV domain-containing protein, partial [Ignavibacteria bacterium]|nr:ASPIC/UnbV domain-containing protein [Ignavibacteria bacterium]